jgi:hypothetical protein
MTKSLATVRTFPIVQHFRNNVEAVGNGAKKSFKGLSNHNVPMTVHDNPSKNIRINFNSLFEVPY